MKTYFLHFSNKIKFPLYCIVIFIAILRDYIVITPNYYYMSLRVLILLGVFIVAIGNIIKPYSFKRTIGSNKDNKLKEYIYLNSYRIIETIFNWYFFLFALFQLNKASIFFSYFMLLILGLYYGNKIVYQKLHNNT